MRMILLAALVAVCGVPAQAAPATPLVRAVASFSILVDLVRQVGGDRVQVEALVGAGGDTHMFTPSPADARRIAGAAVVFVNGLGFDPGVERLLKASGARAALVVASDGVRPLDGSDGPADHADDEGGAHGRGGIDPHAWQSVPNVKIYVRNIRDGLSRVDPAGAAIYAANADAYAARLDGLDVEVRQAVARLPPSRRRIITTHTAFAYFAREYGLTFLAPEGVSTEADPSARSVARLIEQVRRHRVGALFVETMTDRRLIERVAAETGARIGAPLYSDALSGPDGAAPTYVDMIRNNIASISGLTVLD